MDIRLKRFIAIILDYMIVFFSIGVISQIIGMLTTSIEIYVAITAVVIMLIVFLYFTILPIFYNGMTIGSSIVKIKIVANSGKEAGFFRLLFRNYNLLLGGAVSLLFAVLFEISDKIKDKDINNLPEELQQAYDTAVSQINYALSAIIFIFIVFGVSVLIMGYRGLQDLMGRTTVVDSDY